MYLYAISADQALHVVFIGPVTPAQLDATAQVFPYLANMAGDPLVALGFCEHFRAKVAEDVAVYTMQAYAERAAALNPTSPDLGPLREALVLHGLVVEAPAPESEPLAA